jgi:hypothetical protein
MSDMRKLLESMDKFAGEPEQKPGDQVRGTDNPKKSGKKHGFHGRLVGEGLDEFTQQLLNEYHKFVQLPEADLPGNPTSPVANINPAGQGLPQTNGQNGTANKVPGANTSVTNQTAQVPTPPGVKPPAPGQPPVPANQQPNPAQVAAAKQQQMNMTQNMQSLKTLDPNMNVNKTLDAVAKDPTKANAVDGQQLAGLVNTLEPVLKDKTAFQTLKGKIQQLTPKA